MRDVSGGSRGDGVAVGGGGRLGQCGKGRDQRGVRDQDVGDDLDADELECFVAFGEAVEEEGEVFGGEVLDGFVSDKSLWRNLGEMERRSTR